MIGEVFTLGDFQCTRKVPDADAKNLRRLGENRTVVTRLATGQLITKTGPAINLICFALVGYGRLDKFVRTRAVLRVALMTR